MTTLILVRNSSGVVGRCDARCYNADGDVCDCVCGGANHGKGYGQAVANVRACMEQLVAEALDARHEQGDVEFGVPILQLSMFDA